MHGGGVASGGVADLGGIDRLIQGVGGLGVRSGGDPEGVGVGAGVLGSVDGAHLEHVHTRRRRHDLHRLRSTGRRHHRARPGRVTDDAIGVLDHVSVSGSEGERPVPAHPCIPRVVVVIGLRLRITTGGIGRRSDRRRRRRGVVVDEIAGGGISGVAPRAVTHAVVRASAPPDLHPLRDRRGQHCLEPGPTGVRADLRRRPMRRPPRPVIPRHLELPRQLVPIRIRQRRVRRRHLVDPGRRIRPRTPAPRGGGQTLHRRLRRRGVVTHTQGGVVVEAFQPSWSSSVAARRPRVRVDQLPAAASFIALVASRMTSPDGQPE